LPSSWSPARRRPRRRRSAASTRSCKAGWYLLELINEILDLALIESGKAVAVARAGVAGRGAAECQAMIEPQAQQARHRHDAFPRLDAPVL
jgi:signal transduction histidine kinase